MENGSSSREARRKKILSRGSDRMALITGTINSLPPSSTSTPVSSTGDDQIQVPQPNCPDQIKVVGLEGDAPDSSLRTNNVTGNEEALNANAFFHIGSKDVPLVLEGEKRVEKKQAPVGELTNKLQQCPHTSVVQKSSISTERPSKLHNQRRVSLTPKQISSCIMSSEATRIICSLTIALLVVLSYVDRPLLGRNLVKSESVVASRPFYILLLTDITILLARLSIERRRAMEKAKEEEEEEEERMSRHEEDGQNWAGAIKVLETGLVVYQSICAVFMDFCVYAVVVICGLSFV